MDETVWAVNLPKEYYDKYAPRFADPSRKFRTVERHTKNVGNGMSLVMAIYANDAAPNDTLWSQLALYKNEIKVACSKDGEEIDEELCVEYDGRKFSAVFVKPDEVTAYVHQIPVDVSFDCPTCEGNFVISYDEFCDGHGDPPDWTTTTVRCPYCGQELVIEDQDWS